MVYIKIYLRVDHPECRGDKRSKLDARDERKWPGRHGDKKSNQDRIEKHLPVIPPRPGTAISRPGVSSASISLQSL